MNNFFARNAAHRGYNPMGSSSTPTTATPSMASAPASVSASGASSLAGEPLATRWRSAITQSSPSTSAAVTTVSTQHNDMSAQQQNGYNSTSGEEAPFSFRFKPSDTSADSGREVVASNTARSHDDLSFLLSLSAKSLARSSATPSPSQGASSPPQSTTAPTLTAPKSSSNTSSIYSAASDGSATAPPAVARVWPCAKCGLLLAVCHLAGAVVLMVFDAATNPTTQAAIPVSAAFAFFIAALFAFMAARRLDRIAQALLLAVSVVCCALCALMFVDSARHVNATTTTTPTTARTKPTTTTTVEICGGETDAKLAACLQNFAVFHIVLMCIALIEFVLFGITIIVCFRSLRNAYGVPRVNSPYSTLIVGDYAQLIVTPPPKPAKTRRNILPF